MENVFNVCLLRDRKVNNVQFGIVICIIDIVKSLQGFSTQGAFTVHQLCVEVESFH